MRRPAGVRWKTLLTVWTAVCLSAVLLCCPAAAVRSGEYSPWAREEIAEADRLGLIPSDLSGSGEEGITRREFTEAAVFFLAAEFRVDVNTVLNRRYADDSVPASPFTDTDDPFVRAAHFFGIVGGRGNGVFDPDALITRQEAARILLNVYLAYAADPSLPDSAEASGRYRDGEKIADWARSPVSVMGEWGVMRGVDRDLFSPDTAYTREQCFVTFLRLWKNAPCGRFVPDQGGVRSVQTFEEALAGIRSVYGYSEVAYAEARDFALLLYTARTGRPGAGYCRIVWRDGGSREIIGELPDGFLQKFSECVPGGFRSSGRYVYFDWSAGGDGDRVRWWIDPDDGEAKNAETSDYPAELLAAGLLSRTGENRRICPLMYKRAVYADLTDAEENDLWFADSSELLRFEAGTGWVLWSFVGDGWSGQEILAAFGMGEGIRSALVRYRGVRLEGGRTVSDPAVMETLDEAVRGSDVLSRLTWSGQRGGREEDRSEALELTLSGRYGPVLELTLYPGADLLSLRNETYFCLEKGWGRILADALTGTASASEED